MSDKPSGSFIERYLTPIAVIVGAIIIAVAFAFGHGGTTGTQQAATGTQTAPSVNIANVKTSGEPFVGNANAPVTMALFFDYQCPFCKQFDATVVSQLYTNYVQTGKLKIVFKDFDFLGPDSITASEFARALWQLYPDQFYAWYSAVYANQLEESHTADASYLPHLESVAGKLQGVDVNKVVALMNQNKTTYDTTVQADFTEGQGYGIQGTPSVIVGTTLLQGAQSYQAVSALIDAQLKK
ncbi:MAG: thioredoxin domain-containing protein [Candidatus Pacebacteria bacterium]|nr:thioredoxin domain-containing protein [Candidatus Paceibacterota bacterium]